MLQALRKLFGVEGQSKSVARSRLSFVLVQDRTGLTSEEMSKFRKELIGVIEKYFEIDEQGFDVSYRRETESTVLQINSPVLVTRKKVAITKESPAAANV